MKKTSEEEENPKIPEITSTCEYIEYLRKPKKVLWVNFVRGIANGLGMAVGFTLLGALVLYLLRSMVKLNLPLIGQFIAEIVKIVQESLKR